MKYFLYIIIVVGLFANEDLSLANLAYSNGLRPVPDNYKILLSVINKNQRELSKEKISLGKKLFFEKSLSLGKDISCSTCHSFDKGGADGLPTAIGHMGQKNPFHLNTPTVLNTTFSKKYFWNGKSNTLEDQAKGPMQALFEMSITPKLAMKRIQEKKAYKDMFEKVYGQNSITFENIANAISAYEQNLISRGRYDDFLLGKVDALSKTEKDGLKLFITKGCVGCHNGIGFGGQVLRKFPLTYHNIWIIAKPDEVKNLQKKYNDFLSNLEKRSIKGNDNKINYMRRTMGEKDIELLKKGFFNRIDSREAFRVMATTACMQCHEKNTNQIKRNLVKVMAFPFENTGGFMGYNATKYFRVPLLRNVVQTKPYFHNGSVQKLEDAIKIMGIHQSRVDLTKSDIAKIISFLKAINGKAVELQ